MVVLLKVIHTSFKSWIDYKTMGSWALTLLQLNFSIDFTLETERSDSCSSLPAQQIHTDNRLHRY